MKRTFLLCAVALMPLCGASVVADAQQRPQNPAEAFRAPIVSIGSDGGYVYPVGDNLDGGITGGLAADFRPSSFPRLVTIVELGYGLLTVPMALELAPVRLGVARVSAGAGYTLGSLARLAITPLVSGGIYFARNPPISLGPTLFLIGGTGPVSQSNYLLEAGASVQYRLSSRFTVTSNVRFGFLSGLAYSNLSAGIGIRWVPVLAQPAEPIRFDDPSFQRLFPSLFRTYARVPAGTVEITNTGDRIAEDIRVTFFVARFMQDPQSCSAPSSLAPGERSAIDIFPLLSPDVLEITEGLEVQGIVAVDYSIRGKRMRTERVFSLGFHDRNAVQWDDDEKAAAFVTARDHTVLAFARNAVSVTDGTTSPLINNGLKQAIVLFSALGEHNVAYLADPTTPYRVFSEDPESVDFLQFPRQTLAYRAGDCDDVSVLYAALLESVGVPAAFITIPGHIFTAIDLGMAPDEARAVFSSPDDLIFADETTWLPLETTLLHNTFDYAWYIGAQQWREHFAVGEASLYPVRDAWKTYEPVGISGDLVELPGLSDQTLADRVEREVDRVVQREIQVSRDRLLERLERSPDDPALLNRLGVLYARFGLDVEAEEQLSKAIAANQHAPAAMNLATIYLARGEPEAALELYGEVQRQDPGSALAVLGIARSYYAMASFAEAREWHGQLARLAPELAREFEFVASASGGTARATSADAAKGSFLWVE